MLFIDYMYYYYYIYYLFLNDTFIKYFKLKCWSSDMTELHHMQSTTTSPPLIFQISIMQPDEEELFCRMNLNEWA